MCPDLSKYNRCLSTNRVKRRSRKKQNLCLTLVQFSLHSIIQQVELNLLCVRFNRGLLRHIVFRCHTGLWKTKWTLAKCHWQGPGISSCRKGRKGCLCIIDNTSYVTHTSMSYHFSWCLVSPAMAGHLFFLPSSWLQVISQQFWDNDNVDILTENINSTEPKICVIWPFRENKITSP